MIGCVCAHTCPDMHANQGQRTICGSWFSLSTLCVSEIILLTFRLCRRPLYLLSCILDPDWVPYEFILVLWLCV